MYTFSFHKSRSLFEVRLRGFWHDAKASNFLTELIHELRRLDAMGERYCALVDATEFPVQSVTVGEILRGIQAPANRPERLPTAIVVGSALAKMQVERYVGSSQFRAFSDRTSATKWLDQEMTERGRLPGAAAA